MWGIFAIYTGDLEWFNNNRTCLIRIYQTDVYSDEKVTEADGRKLINLFLLFSQTQNNNVGKAYFSDYVLKFVKKNKLANSWTVVKEETRKALSDEELKEIIDEWNAQSNDKVIYNVQV